ncbi:hypothetical protein LIER_02058 [Lithospermum erythrorhizon]|uniref:Flotillin-like n=1 Tax=Lithospermum erythrorhizon TaxID=34254 RepID=A0AAV3NN41_LITER
MYYKVVKASELLVITGKWIVNYNFVVNAISVEKVGFMVPVVFTIGPKLNDDKSILKYAKLLSMHARDSNQVTELLKGLVEGKTRLLAASRTMEDIFKNSEDFNVAVFDMVQTELNPFGLLIYHSNIMQLADGVSGYGYFNYLGEKVKMEAANQVEIDVAEAKMIAEIASKEKQRTALQNAAKIDAETKVITSQMEGHGQKEQIKVQTEVKIFEKESEVTVAKANFELETNKANWAMLAKMAQVEAEKSVAIREAELQQLVETKNALTKYEIKVHEANLELYKKHMNAEAQRMSADAQLYSRQQEAEAELFAKKKETEAKDYHVRTLLSSLGGNYNALRDFMMIDGGLFQDLAKTNVQALNGLQPKISISTNGDGGSSENVLEGDLLVQQSKSWPLFQAVHEQTGMQPPSWLGDLTNAATTS